MSCSFDPSGVAELVDADQQLGDRAGVVDGSVADALVADALVADAVVADADQSCGPGAVVTSLELGVTVFGDTLTGGSMNLDAVCSTTGGPEHIYVVALPGAGDYLASTNAPGTLYDDIIYVRLECSNPLSEFLCSDAPPPDSREVFFTVAEPTLAYVIIDSHGGSGGPYELTVTAL